MRMLAKNRHDLGNFLGLRMCQFKTSVFSWMFSRERARAWKNYAVHRHSSSRLLAEEDT